MQDPVYMLHLITCHRRIMPRLAELLLNGSLSNLHITSTGIKSWTSLISVQFELLA